MGIAQACIFFFFTLKHVVWAESDSTQTSIGSHSLDPKTVVFWDISKEQA